MKPSLPATASRDLVWPELISGILIFPVSFNGVCLGRLTSALKSYT